MTRRTKVRIERGPCPRCGVTMPVGDEDESERVCDACASAAAAARPAPLSYHDLLGCSTASAARQLLERARSGLIRGRDAVELVGARRAREFCPPGRWDEPVAQGELLRAWRTRVVERAFLRWEAHMRRV